MEPVFTWFLRRDLLPSEACCVRHFEVRVRISVRAFDPGAWKLIPSGTPF